MPRDRIDLFTRRARELCAQAGLPQFDDTHYDVLRDTLTFFWNDPPFTVEADLGKSSINGLTPELLRQAYDAKFPAFEGSLRPPH